MELLNPDLNTTIPYISETEKNEIRNEYEKKPKKGIREKAGIHCKTRRAT